MQRLATALLLVGGLGLTVISCTAGGEEDTSMSTALSQEAPASVTASAAGPEPALADAEQLSTFKLKDPFIQQAVSTAEPSTTTPPTTYATTTTTRPGATTTIYCPTTVTWHHTTTTTSRPSTTTTTHPPTTTTTKPPLTTTTATTVLYLHMLKILSIEEVDGRPVVTFQVDNSVYKDRGIGDVVSTSWGQIKVLDLNSTSKVVTLLHGSETLVLSAGQEIYQ